ncbi:MAG: U32 family peptidase [Solobacterium sp.]|nr:U32 family peptidase [Solobacterium sp.]
MVKRQLNKVELLAPSGDLKRCKTAIRYGADAVYIGGQSFSLRSRASNFSLEEIKEACLFAKEYGAHIHVTVNAIHHDEDLEGIEDYLRALEEIGVTAIIVASPYVMQLAKKVAPKLEVHSSTQMSVTSHQAAQFLIDHFQVDRIVLARECSLNDVRRICETCPKDIEAFIHGGMCVNYSGRCTLSNRMTLRDANRGGCAQSCRWQYHLYQGKDEVSDGADFTMGSKDLCAALQIKDLMDAGVKSFKIEGRMKTEYYVATIVNAYRNLIDDLCNKDELSEEELEYHLREIRYAENRDTASGFYEKEAGEESIIYHATSNVDVNHDFLAVVRKYDETTHTALIEVRNVFSKGERIEVLSPRKKVLSFIVEEAKDEEGLSLERMNHPMQLVEIKVPFALKEEDILRRAR